MWGCPSNQKLQQRAMGPQNLSQMVSQQFPTLKDSPVFFQSWPWHKGEQALFISLVISPGPKPLILQTKAKEQARQNLPFRVPSKGSGRPGPPAALEMSLLYRHAQTVETSWALPHPCLFCFASLHSSMKHHL